MKQLFCFGFSSIFSVIFFYGCQFQYFQIINKHGYKERVFENLYQGGIWDGVDLKATIKAVYMNDVDKTYFNKNYDVFFVSIYIFDNKLNKNGLDNPFYSISLNGQMPQRIEELTEDSELYNKISFSTNWFKNYLIYFYPIDDKNLQLKFENKNFKSVILHHKKGIGENREYPTVMEKLIREK